MTRASASKQGPRTLKVYTLSNKNAYPTMICIARSPEQAMDIFLERSRTFSYKGQETNISAEFLAVIESPRIMPVDAFIRKYELAIEPVETGIVIAVGDNDGVPYLIGPTKSISDEDFRAIIENIKVRDIGTRIKQVSQRKLKERAGEIAFKPGGRKYQAQKEFIMKCTDRMMAFSQRELLDAATKIGIDIDPRATKEEICKALNEYAEYADPADIGLPEVVGPYFQPYTPYRRSARLEEKRRKLPSPKSRKKKRFAQGGIEKPGDYSQWLKENQ